MERWLEAQRRVVELLESADHPGHPVDWAEGYRWATRIASLAQEWAVERSDPLRPELFLSQGPTRKLMVDNPDVDYRFAVLDRRERYRLSGWRGEASVVGLTIGTDVLRGATGRTGTLGQYQLDDFDLAPDGTFEIHLSAEPEPGNHILLPEGAAQLAVRETFHDRRTQRPARLELERLGPPLPPEDLLPARAAERIEVAARFLVFVAETCVGMWRAFGARLNVIAGAPGRAHVEAQRDEVRTHSATDMAYQGGRFRLEEGQALRVTIHPAAGGTRYWGIVLVNPWMESYEYRQRSVCTNDRLAVPNPDGSHTVVIAAEDPGVPNWLDTGGRREGYALLRWVLPASPPPDPTCELVSVAELRAGSGR